MLTNIVFSLLSAFFFLWLASPRLQKAFWRAKSLSKHERPAWWHFASVGVTMMAFALPIAAGWVLLQRWEEGLASHLLATGVLGLAGGSVFLWGGAEIISEVAETAGAIVAGIVAGGFGWLVGVAIGLPHPAPLFFMVAGYLFVFFFFSEGL